MTARPGNLSAFSQHIIIAVLIIGSALAFWIVRDAVLMVFAAALIAIAIHGIADFLERIRPMPYPAALAVSTLLLAGFIVGTLFLFGFQIGVELAGVADRIPQAWEKLRSTLQQNPAGAAVASEIDNLLSTDSGGRLSGLLKSAGGYALPLASGVTSVFLVLFIAGFLTTSAKANRKGILLLMPSGFDAKVASALDACTTALRKWLLGVSLDMLIIGIAMAIVLGLLGVPAFIGLALIAGIAQFVPTVGPMIAAVPGILLAFTVGPMTALWAGLAYLVVSQLEANLIYPLIQQKTASVPPALNLFAILAFGLLLGPLGVLLATPLLIVLTVFVIRLYVQGTLGKDARVPGEAHNAEAG